MALAKLHTFTLVGIDAILIDVEVDVTPSGLPQVILVGLAETAVKESIHRVDRAITNSAYQRPGSRCVINLAPGDLKKDAVAFDLPIAMGMLAGTGQIPVSSLKDTAFCGELALDGSTRPIKGALSMALACKRVGLKRLVVPAANAQEAAVVEGLDVYPANSLAESVALAVGRLDIDPIDVDVDALFDHSHQNYDVDFADVRGQEAAKRALLIAAAGRHNVLLAGPPGTGKTMLAVRVPTIMPKLSLNESLEVTKIYSAIGKTSASNPLKTVRPFRSPHHTSSEAGMIGGGSNPQPGEVSLAHHGVLFLDELPEFNRRTLEVLRQPLEEGTVTVTRATAKLTFPSDFLLIAAMNPCPCGYFTDPRKECHCTPQAIERYLGRISGPLLDRIDIQLEVPPVPFEELRREGSGGTSSAQLRVQVEKARARQRERLRATKSLTNGRMSGRQVREICKLDDAGSMLLKQAVEELGLSIRAHDRVLRVARTIADLEDSDHIAPQHLAEAVQYRRLDQKLWS